MSSVCLARVHSEMIFATGDWWPRLDGRIFATTRTLDNEKHIPGVLTRVK